MPRQLIMIMPKNVASIANHPTRILERIRTAARNLSSVDFSENINDLTLARKAPMSSVWACLESGGINKDHIHHELQGVFAKLEHDFAGTLVTVDVLLQNNGTLYVLFAEAEEY